MELLKIRVEPAYGSRALRLELTAVMHENAQVLDVLDGRICGSSGFRRAILQISRASLRVASEFADPRAGGREVIPRRRFCGHLC
jgi:hypothetical protein